MQLSSVFHLTQDPAQPGYEYLGVRVTVLNRSKTDSYTIGAQAWMPSTPLTRCPLSATWTPTSRPWPLLPPTLLLPATSGCCHQCTVSLYNSNSQSFSDSESLPPAGLRLHRADADGAQELEGAAGDLHATFAPDKTLTFTMKAADVIRG